LLKAQGDLAGAQPLLERALAITEKVHGPEHLYTASSLEPLAGLLQARGNFAGARLLYERTLAIYVKEFGSTSWDAKQMRGHLGLLFLISHMPPWMPHALNFGAIAIFLWSLWRAVQWLIR
jgi:hypothetical protein